MRPNVVMLFSIIKRRQDANKRKMALLNSLGKYLYQRRQAILTSIQLLENLTQFLISQEPPPRIRSCKRVARNTGWWQKVSTSYSEKRFKQPFRISRSTFDYILSFLNDKLQRQYVTEEPIQPDERLAICLYRLMRGITSSPYRGWLDMAKPPYA